MAVQRTFSIIKPDATKRNIPAFFVRDVLRLLAETDNVFNDRLANN